MTRHRGFTVFDVETTGLSAKHGHRIIEIGIVRLDEDLDVIEKWETLINPNRDIGKQEIHGIESRDLLNAPSFEDIAADIWHRFDGAVPVAHNLRFDSSFILEELRRLGISVEHFKGLCTLNISRRSPHIGKSLKLPNVCAELNIPVSDHHTAGMDAILCANIFTKLCQSQLDEFSSLPGVQCPELNAKPATPQGITRQKVRERTVESPLNIVASRITANQITNENDPEAITEYMLILDRAIEDRNIDSTETDQLCSLATELGISQQQLAELNRDYIKCLVQYVLSDGHVAQDERQDLYRVGELLGVDRGDIDNWLVADVKIDDLPEDDLSGQTVCFTGTSRCSLQGKPLDNPQKAQLATNAGLSPVTSVTKKLNILVVADPDTQSGKAKKARNYGVRIISERAFWQKLGVNIE